MGFGQLAAIEVAATVAVFFGKKTPGVLWENRGRGGWFARIMSDKEVPMASACSLDFAGFFALSLGDLEGALFFFFAIEFVTATADFVFKFFLGAAKFANGAAHATSELGKFFGTKEKKDDGEDEEHLGATEVREKGDWCGHDAKRVRGERRGGKGDTHEKSRIFTDSRKSRGSTLVQTTSASRGGSCVREFAFLSRRAL